MTSTKTPAAPEATTPATKAWTAATKATAAAADAVQPARDALEAARETLVAAEAEALAAVTTKCADPAAARDRIQKSRDAIRKAADDVNWAVLQLHAFEVQEEDAREAEQAARRRVMAEEYARAYAEFNDPNSRENQLLSQLRSTVAELIPLILDRKDLHDRLVSEWEHLPPDERPQLKGGRLMATSTRLIGLHIQDLTPEVADAIKAGIASAMGELARRRAQRFS